MQGFAGNSRFEVITRLGQGGMGAVYQVFDRERSVRVELKSVGCRGGAGGVRIGIMHLAKGLEFKAVAVMACDDDVLPLKARLEAVADETELDDVFDTERQLFYVACTRARDRLMVSGVKPGSQFMTDLRR